MYVVHSRMRNELQNPFAGDTADLHFDAKAKCRTGWASFWVKFPTAWNKTPVKCLFGGGGGGLDYGFRTDWYRRSFFY